MIITLGYAIQLAFGTALIYGLWPAPVEVATTIGLARITGTACNHCGHAQASHHMYVGRCAAPNDEIPGWLCQCTDFELSPEQAGR